MLGHMLPEWQCSATCYQNGNVPLQVTRMTMFVPMLLEWQYSATCYQNNNACPHVVRKTMYGHMLPESQCLPICGQDDIAEGYWLWMRFYHINHILPIFHPLTPIVSRIWTLFFSQKAFHSKKEVETAFKDFLTSKLLEFYQTGIINVVNRWQKCVDILRSLF